MTTQPRVRIVIAVTFFAYVLLIRTYDLANSFLMLGEQTRDWAVALGSWTDLPLTGAPSTAGGRGFGPAYYWILWIGRVLVGPFTDNLPHAGGLWVAFLQSVADTCLLVVLARRVNVFLAVAACLLIASAPFDVSISGVIWNPPVAAALVKMATAMALGLGNAPSPLLIAATAAVAWLGVQAHLSAIFMAAPLMAALAATPLLQRQWRRGLIAAGAIAGTILVLQVPYLVARIQDPMAAAGPSTALSSMARADKIAPLASYRVVTGMAGGMLMAGQDLPYALAALMASLVVIVRWRSDLPLLAVTVGPLLGATVLFSTWTRTYDSYWFLTATTSMTLTFFMAVAAMPRATLAPWAGAALLAAVLAWQPARVAAASGVFGYPQYRAMRIGSRELARQVEMLRDIRVTFEVHPTMDKYIIFETLGGRMDPAAAHTGFIEADGSVRIQ